MVSEWTTAALSAVCREVRYGYTASATERDTGTKFLRVTDISSGPIDWASVPFCEISDKDYERHRLEPGDIVIARMGTIGVSAMMTESNRAVAASYLIRHRIDSRLADPRYVAYVLKSPAFSDFVWSYGGGGAVQPNINAAVLGEFDIPIPPLLEQQAIAYILGTLDDKIELNRRMNETLEAIARAIFKSWFVDFDPVRAKADGRQPAGMDAATADLFPDSLEDSELGRIPKGWKVESLDDIADYLNGLALQKYPPNEGESLPVIKIAQLRKGAVEGADRASASIDPVYIVDDGDVLFSWSGSLEVVIWCGGRGALNQHLFRVTSETYPKWFYYLWTKHHLPDFRLIAAGKATTMGHIQRHHLSEAHVAAPDSQLLEAMDKLVEPLVDRVIANSIELRTLAGIRDAVLPKLLSGEIQVNDAERFVKEAV